jgi:hypothetical protein
MQYLHKHLPSGNTKRLQLKFNAGSNDRPGVHIHHDQKSLSQENL